MSRNRGRYLPGTGIIKSQWSPVLEDWPEDDTDDTPVVQQPASKPLAPVVTYQTQEDFLEASASRMEEKRKDYQAAALLYQQARTEYRDAIVSYQKIVESVNEHVDR